MSDDAHVSPSAPNIILVCVDQMRFDAMSCAAADAADTPYLDQLATRGNRFTRAYSATPTCVPARVALMTGQSPERHGRYGYREGIDVTRAHPVTLPGTLRDAGYQTHAVGKMHVHPERARIGFDDVQLHDGFLHVGRRLSGGPHHDRDDYLPWLREQTGDPWADYQDTGAGCNAVAARPWEREERLHPTRWVADQSLRFLARRDPTRPFFLYTSFHRPHAPLDPPGWLWEKYRSRPPRQRPVGPWIDRFAEHRRDGEVEAAFATRPEHVHRDARAGYLGSIEFIDLQINRLMEGLSDQGLLENTAILFTSDHGDMMGDHDLHHKAVAYEGSAHIPLLLWLPPALREQWGPTGNVEAICELRDVMPTILDLAGVPIPESVDGHSLRPAVAERAEVRDHLHGEHVISALGHHGMHWIRWGDRKYVWFSGDGHEQLFDLATDPCELTDLAGDPAATEDLAHGRELLIEHLRDREEGFVADGVLTAGRTVQSEASWVREHA
ncbi:MAG: arylsulfatase, partial [Brachybacterium sp.]|nr:arylsulfatase [Brachybacterium sp.]